MHLVLVESGAKAKTIQGYLNGFGMGTFEVMASLGHVMDLPVKTMGVDLTTWTPDYTVNEGRKALVKKIIQRAKEADRVYLAADPDREGEAIAANIKTLLVKAGILESQMCRVAFHEITKEALREAITNPRPLDLNLVAAQETRRILDRVVGYEASPLLWRRFATGSLSAGRVQSAALKLVVQRYTDAMAHSYDPYWTLHGQFRLAKWDDELPAKAVGEWDDPEKILHDLTRLSKATAWNIAFKQTTGTRRPSPPFTTATLQQEAAAKHGFSIETTMKTAQELYEMGAITYMRTDSTTLSKLAKEKITEWIREQYGADKVHLRHFKTTVANAQEAHEAIRPTDFTSAGEAKLHTEFQQKLYRLIWRRTVASHMAEAKVLCLSYTIVPEDSSVVFKGNDEVLTELGYLKVMQPETVVDTERIAYIQSLSTIGEGCVAPVSFLCQGDVKRPEPLYQEASLVKQLEKKGIGRPSTFAPILKKLLTKGYVSKGGLPSRTEKVVHYRMLFPNTDIQPEEEVLTIGGKETKALVPSSLGVRIIEYLEASLETMVNIDFTATMETQLDIVSRGEQTKQEVLDAFYQVFHPSVEKAMEVQASAAQMKSAKPMKSAKQAKSAKKKETPLAPKTVLKAFPDQGANLVQTRYGLALFIAENNSWISVAPFMEWRAKTMDGLDDADVQFLRSLPLKVAGTSMEIHMGRYGLYVKDTEKAANLTLDKEAWESVFQGDWTPESIREKIKAPTAVRLRTRRGSK